MKNNWKVQINHEGDLLIAGRNNNGQVQNLFGAQRFESGVCVHAHYLKPVRKLLTRLFPDSSIRNIETMEEVIRDEFCVNRSISIFKRYLEKAQIPYIAYSHVA